MNVVPTTIQDFLDSILGIYTPTIATLSNGTEVALSGFAGVDWCYIIRACTFLIVVYCTLKVIGGMICKTY